MSAVLKPVPPPGGPKRAAAASSGDAQSHGSATAQREVAASRGSQSARVPRAGFASPRLPTGRRRPPSAPGLSVHWGALQEPSLPPLLVNNGDGHIQRRYFFTERAHETDRMPAQKHFDVVMEDNPPEQAADYLYCRYVDFLKDGEPDAAKLGLINEDQQANPEEISKWLRNARPRTRLDAAPMFVLAKQLVNNLLDGDLAAAHRRRELADKARRAIEEKIEVERTAHNQKEARIREAAKIRELELTKETMQVRQQLAATKANVAELSQQVEDWAAACARRDDEIAQLQQEVTAKRGVENVLVLEQKRLGGIIEVLQADVAKANDREGLESEEIDRLNGLLEKQLGQIGMLEVKLDDRDAKAEQLEAELHSTELSLQEREQKIENLGQELETLNEGLELAQAELKGVARLPKVNVNMRGADEEAVAKQQMEELLMMNQRYENTIVQLTARLEPLESMKKDQKSTDSEFERLVKEAEMLMAEANGDLLAEEDKIELQAEDLGLEPADSGAAPTAADDGQPAENAVTRAKREKSEAAMAAEAGQTDAKNDGGEEEGKQEDEDATIGSRLAEAAGTAEEEAKPEAEPEAYTAPSPTYAMADRTRENLFKAAEKRFAAALRLRLPPEVEAARQANKTAQLQALKAKVVARGDKALKLEPPGWQVAVDSYTEAMDYSRQLGIQPGEDEQLESALEHAHAGLDYWQSEQQALAAQAAEEEKKAKQAELEALGVHAEVLHQWGDVVTGNLKRQRDQMQAYKKVLSTLDWVRTRKAHQEEEAERQRVAAEEDARRAEEVSQVAADAEKLTDLAADMELATPRAGTPLSKTQPPSTMRKWRAAFIKTLWKANKARPFAFGKLEDQCRDAIEDDPHNEELQQALKMAADERERAMKLQEEVLKAQQELADALEAAEAADSARPDQTDSEKIAWFQREVDRLKSKIQAAQDDAVGKDRSLAQLKRLAETEKKKLSEQNMQYEANAVEFKLAMSQADRRIASINEALSKARERQQELREEFAAELSQAEAAHLLARKEMAARFVKATGAISQMVLMPKDTVVGRPLEKGEVEALLLLLAEGGEPLEAARALGRQIQGERPATAPAESTEMATQCDLGPALPPTPAPTAPEAAKQASPEPAPIQPRKGKRTVRLLERQLPIPVPMPMSPVRTAYTPRSAGVFGPMHRESSCNWFVKAQEPMQMTLTATAAEWPQARTTAERRGVH